ncbi:MAG: hypothetical protein IT429_16920 [Gemmataceae bacterium]|nr:hypothetical protein [Gemmataceae bacterium]
MAEPQTKDLLQQEKDKEIDQKKFDLKTKELIQLQVGQPVKSPSVPKVIKMVEGPGANTIELKVGQGLAKVIQLQEGPGANSIELSVGPNKIRIDEKGITIEGLKIQVKGQIQLQLQAPILQANGDGMIKMQGGIVMIN